MKKRISNSLRFATGCALAVLGGLAQATDLTLVDSYVGNISWQNIGGVSYIYADSNHDGQVNVGDTVTFTVDMEKTYWGTHRFDALKVWIDDGSTNLYSASFEWNYAPSHKNMKWFGKPGDPFSYKLLTKGDQYFSFDYTFTTAGTFDLAFSVTCSRDLSGLSGPADDLPTTADWDAWTQDIHKVKTGMQGEDKDYQLTVTAVPEPETYAMLLAGLGLIGAMTRRRKG